MTQHDFIALENATSEMGSAFLAGDFSTVAELANEVIALAKNLRDQALAK